MVHSLTQPRAVAEWLRARVRGRLQCDSRQVAPGDAFVAWPGAATDGRRFVASALQAGAGAVLVEQAGVDAFAFDDERVLAVPGLKALAGPIASAWNQDPSASLDVIAFTGTNGKTTSAWWMAQLMSALQRPCALVGTLGIGQPPLAGHASVPAIVSTGLTTPDPVLLQASLRAMVDGGLKACAIEASSIGLVEGRLNACRIRVAVLSNFTQDHLDFHGSMADYWNAKAALFQWPGLASAVLNLDDAMGVQLAAGLRQRDLDLWTFAIESIGQVGQARLFATDLAFTTSGMAFTLGERGPAGELLHSAPLRLPLIGRYNVSNLLGVLAAARALGVGLNDAVAACAALSAVPGRMEQALADAPGRPLVLVDYAHTPDALEKALQALAPLAHKRGGALWAVVGCGGDRDAGKRPLMAAAAEREATELVLTSDNPRSEDPLAILSQMQAGLTRPARVEPDRAAAIAMAVASADARDVVLIAGKGHEDYQDVMGVKKPFSDQQHARAALLRRAPDPEACT
jgi:UDP-N-acetylmuramyl-tripeptide synthetase